MIIQSVLFTHSHFFSGHESNKILYEFECVCSSFILKKYYYRYQNEKQDQYKIFMFIQLMNSNLQKKSNQSGRDSLFNLSMTDCCCECISRSATYIRMRTHNTKISLLLLFIVFYFIIKIYLCEFIHFH